MPKRRIRKSIKSFFGIHIDPQKVTLLKEAKEDIDYKVEKILELIKDEDSEGKTEIPLPNSKKEPLRDLLEKFRDQYNTLYGYYDDITGELRKKVQSKHGKDNSSLPLSSSDSELEYSSKGKGSKNGRWSERLELELETARQEISELREKLKVTNVDKEALRTRMHELENIVEGLQIGNGRLDEENTKVSAQNDEASVKLNNLSKETEELVHRLEEVNDEKEYLIIKSYSNKSAIQEGEKTIVDLKMTADTLEEENKTILSELVAVKKLQASAQMEVAELKNSHKIGADENTSLSLQIIEKRSMMLAQVAELEQKLNEKDEEIDGLTKKLEEKELSSAGKIQDLSSQIENLQQEVDSLCAKEVESEKLLELKSVEALNQVKNLMDQIKLMRHELDSVDRSKGLLEEQLKSRLIVINQLKEENETMKAKHYEMEKMLIDSEDALAMGQKKFDDHENEASAQIFSLTEHTFLLQASNIELQELLEGKTNESAKHIKGLTDQISDMKQKLEFLENHIIGSESELGRKTKEIAVFENALGALNRDLERMTVDHQRLLEEKTTIATVMKDLELQVDSLLNQTSELKDQLVLLTEEVRKHIGEKNELNEKVSQVEISSHQIASLTAEQENLKLLLDGLKTQNKELRIQAENEKQVSSRNLQMAEEKIKSMVNKVRELEAAEIEKDDKISCLGQEKRDAIKQLCILIDYHRERCDYFKDMVTKLLPVSGAQRSS